MGQNALQLESLKVKEVTSGATPSLRLVLGGKGIRHAILPREIVVLGSILAVLQILDGVLTGIGMHWYGTSMEGNALLRSLMHFIGYIPALIIVKSCSIGLIALLCFQAPKMTWLKQAFYGVIALYIFAAVVPWSYIILADLLA